MRFSDFSVVIYLIVVEFNFWSARNCYIVLLQPKRLASTSAGVSSESSELDAFVVRKDLVYDAKYTWHDMQIASNCKYEKYIHTLHRLTYRLVGKWISPSFVAQNFNQSLSHQQKHLFAATLRRPGRQEDLLQLNPAAMAITGLPQKAWWPSFLEGWWEISDGTWWH